MILVNCKDCHNDGSSTPEFNVRLEHPGRYCKCPAGSLRAVREQADLDKLRNKFTIEWADGTPSSSFYTNTYTSNDITITTQFHA